MLRSYSDAEVAKEWTAWGQRGPDCRPRECRKWRHRASGDLSSGQLLGARLLVWQYWMESSVGGLNSPIP